MENFQIRHWIRSGSSWNGWSKKKRRQKMNTDEYGNIQFTNHRSYKCDSLVLDGENVRKPVTGPNRFHLKETQKKKKILYSSLNAISRRKRNNNELNIFCLSDERYDCLEITREN